MELSCRPENPMGRDSSLIARTRSDITPEWLTEVLSRSLGAEVIVRAVEVSPLGTGQMGSLHRVRIDYDGKQGEAPASVAIKQAAVSPSVRAACAAMGIYEAETHFYRDAARLFGDSVPHCFLAEIDSKTAWFTLVIEDFEGRAKVGHPATDCTVDRAAQVVVQLAARQAAVLGVTGIAALPWLDKPMGERMFASAAGALDRFLERFGDSLDDHQLRLFERFLPRAVDWVRSWPNPQTLSHGDFRLDNLMFGVENQAAPLIILDWQTVKLAPPVLDVAYYLSSCLPPRILHVSQRELVREYHDALSAAGVGNYSFDQCWNDFRRISPYGMVMSALGAQAAQTERGDAMLITGARNFADFVLSLDAVELLP
jgi:aminoglycoside phosphotransferase (APT) family kinase protein